TAAGVELAEQVLAVAHALDVDALRHAQVAQALPVRSEWAMGDAEETRLGARRHAAQADKRGYVVALVVADLGDDRPERRVADVAVLVLAETGHDQRVGVFI